MIFDCHTHLFGPGMVSGPTDEAIKRAWGPDMNIEATPSNIVVIWKDSLVLSY